MKRPTRARLPVLITANVLGALLALAAILGAIGVMAGPGAAPQLLTIPDCGACNVIVVAKDGGNYTTVEEALAYIAGQTHNASNRWLVYIAPGTYDLAEDSVDEPLQMREYVDIQGAGEGVTKLIRGGGGAHPAGSLASATVLGADHAELRFLTVENTGGSYGTAILNSGTSPTLSHITAIVTGGVNSFGVYNTDSSAVMSDVTAIATGSGGLVHAVSNDNSSTVMRDVTATASGGTDNRGVNNSSSTPVMRDVMAAAIGGGFGVYNNQSPSIIVDVIATATGGDLAYAVANVFASSDSKMTNVVATASGSTGLNIGVYNFAASPTIRGSTIEGSGGSDSYGIYNDTVAATVSVDTSRIAGTTATIFNQAAYIARVGGSLLDGGPVVPGDGSIVCANSHNSAYEFLMPDCATTYVPTAPP